ncbi:D-2-hydroxyacid dehydrogenase [Pseudactinotalea sp. HY158]|nr:D-2-hydroxyacid dehydrogenase [Pseudactinotalea sp. HY158]
MPNKPVVAILHDGRPPPPGPLAPVTEHAEVRLVEAAGLARALHGADVLFAYDFFSPAIHEAWHAADSLRWLHVASAGVDAMLDPQVRASEVVLTNSRGIFDQAIAEYVLAQILTFAKDLRGSWALQRDERWLHRESQRIAGTRALVVGTGPIGRAVARLLAAAGIHVTGGGRRARDRDADFGTVIDVTAPASFHAGLAGADWVVAIAPLTEQTRGMFDAAAFAAMDPAARFINVGRGELARTDDLVTALRAGELAGAALDVVDPEPPPPGHPLWELPGVVLTPHNSGDFIGWRDELVGVFAENFRRWATGRPLRNVVDKHLGYVPSTGG